MSLLDDLLDKFTQKVIDDPSPENIERYIRGSYNLGKKRGCLEAVLTLDEFVDLANDDNYRLSETIDKNHPYDKNEFLDWVLSNKEALKTYNSFGNRVSEETNNLYSRNLDEFDDLVEDLYENLKHTYDTTYPPF